MELRKLSTSKLAPWNWFRHEDEGRDLEIQRVADAPTYSHPLTRMHREMDRLFDETFRAVGFPGLFENESLGRSGDLMLRPSVDIIEQDDGYRITVEVPGIRDDDLQISLEQDRMIISGEKRHEYEDHQEGRLHRVERSYGRFQRVLSLPQDALGDQARARFNQGVLTITVPRDSSRQESRRTIEIEQDSH
ncbi:Hsp20/alpha crystallin family protein [Natronospirillum operosum]|uniref:Hsp20/alpha crystallin family protein n=1 Tax=Natronospirillum operosum TaxID=2759953 RepID=UPI00197C3CC2|nr:Hsp20/alpha crystallin family protein [Natronospirillum operosum]